jgi:GTP:adenosylcobinamide-phosphate guanylyltransferase
MVDAVVLAGGRIPDSEAGFRDAVGVPCKSLIDLEGRIMVGHVVAALRAASGIGRIVVVGPAELQGHPDLLEADRVLPEAEGRSENLYAALDALGGARRVIMCTSDTPLVLPHMVDDALHALPVSVDLGYVLVPYRRAMERFADRPPPPPDHRGRQMPSWVSVRLRDGRFTGTACMVCSPEAAHSMRRILKGVFDDREMGNVVSVLRPVLGLPLLLRIGLALRCPALGPLISVKGLEQRLSRGLGLTGRAYVSPYAELAFDVDHLGDLPIAQRELRKYRDQGVLPV